MLCLLDGFTLDIDSIGVSVSSECVAGVPGHSSSHVALSVGGAGSGIQCVGFIFIGKHLSSSSVALRAALAILTIVIIMSA